MSNDLLQMCPVWDKPCLKESCNAYEVHSKQRFKNKKTGSYIPLDQLSFFKSLQPDILDETVERRITIVRECRKFGKIIQIESTTDSNIPTVED